MASGKHRQAAAALGAGRGKSGAEAKTESRTPWSRIEETRQALHPPPPFAHTKLTSSGKSAWCMMWRGIVIKLREADDRILP